MWIILKNMPNKWKENDWKSRVNYDCDDVTQNI